MSLAILGMGTALPSNRLPREAAEVVTRALCCRTPEQATWLGNLHAQTGIRARHIVIPAEVVGDLHQGTRHSQSIFLPAGPDDDHGPTTAQRMKFYVTEAGTLATKAVCQAIEEARLPVPELTHLVTVSCTGFHAPGWDVELIRTLDLPPTIQRTHVGFMGCHGALNGLRVARALVEADPNARVLLCAVELCSVHFQYRFGSQELVANSLFGDGAAAVVGAPGAAGPANSWQAAASGSCLLPDTEWAMTWSIADHGFVMTLATAIPRLIGTHLRPWLSGWLQEQGLTIEQVAAWAIHPGGPRILSAIEEALVLPRSATAVSWEVLADCGNMSSPTVLFILQRLRDRQAPRPCVALGFGPGLTAEAALLR